MTPASDLAPLAERVHEADAGGVRVLALPTPAEHVVSFRASFRTLPDLAAGEGLVQELCVDLLDKGTRRRDRFALAEALELRGARLTFGADGLRCGFAGRCLRDDLPEVLALAAEQLREPTFDAEEFRKAKTRRAARLRHALEDTATQARGLLTRRLFGADHPNHQPDPKAELARLETLDVEAVRTFHAEHVGASGAIVALAGDLDPVTATETVQAVLGDWPPPRKGAPFAETAAPEPPARAAVPMADRPNLDVRLGHALALRRDSDDFLALHAGVFALGGNFSARLMRTVRDEQGLTYGIGAALSGVTVEYDGYLVVSVSLSREHLERGIAATLDEVRRFVEEGIAPEELAEKQDTLAGSFTVGLATTTGLAGALLVNAERGFPVTYLDRYPDLVRALTPEDVGAAVARHLQPEALHVVVAGTLPED